MTTLELPAQKPKTEKRDATLLIVDDDVSTRETMSDILSLNNFTIKTAGNGAEALKIVEEYDIDLALLDIRLPDVDGLELMTTMQENNQELIFIFMTGFASVEYTRKAFEKGAIGFFVKPVLFEELLHVINQAIEKRNLAREYARSEQERNMALAEYEDLYNSAHDMFASVDIHSGVITQCNDTLLEMLGYSRQEILGQDHHSLYAEFCMPEVEKLWPTLLDSGTESNRELSLESKYEVQIPVSTSATIAKDEMGAPFQVRMVWRDLSGRKRLEEQLLVSEKMTTIAGLAAGVAHEINTPLSGILQSIQLVEMGLDPGNIDSRDEAQRYGVDLAKLREYITAKELDFFLNGIRESAFTAARIVSDLLQFSRPNESEWATSDLGELIKRAIGLSKADYTMKKEYNIASVTFIEDFDPDLPPVKCMAMELEQVLINMIKNSCQAMVEGAISKKNPHIIFRTYSEEQWAVIEVIDNGPGIPPDIINDIFDPFYTTKEVGVGTGLGLSVSYTIISVKHNGEIAVESIPDKATSFIIRLPLDPAG